MAALIAGAAVGIPQAVAGTGHASVSVSSGVTLPLDAHLGYPSTFYSVSCGGRERCVAVGDYTQTTAGRLPLVAPISHGVPGTARSFTLPSDAAATGQDAELHWVTCASASSCLAAGFYKDIASGQEAMVVPITDGVPGAAHKIELPTGHATDSTQYAYLPGLSCPSSSTCVTGGFYTDSSGNRQAMLAPIAGGVPGTTQKVPLPAGAVGGELDVVSCTSSSACLAGGGSYDSSHTQVPIVVPVMGGTAGAPRKAALPGDARSPHPNGAFTALRCASASSCVAAGQYLDTSVDQELIVAPIGGGVPGLLRKVTLPTGALSGGGQNANVRSLSCPSSDSCTMVGDYSFSGGHRAMIVAIAGGKPSKARSVSLPGDAIVSGQNARLTSVSCASSDSCTAVGLYSASGSSTYSVTVAIDGGVPVRADKITLPTDAHLTRQTAALEAVDCTAVSACVAAGQYLPSGGYPEPLVTTVRRRLAITGSLHRAGLRTNYHTRLSAFGGSGTRTWSIVSGKLPRGLRLHHATGKITGIPKAAGSFKVRFRVSDPGPPAQTATRTLRLRVVKPHVKIPRGALRRHGRRVIVPLHCARTRCVGNVKLRLKTAGGTVTIGHHRFKIRPGRTRKLNLRLNATGVDAIQSASHRRLRVLERVAVKHGPNRKHHKTIR